MRLRLRVVYETILKADPSQVAKSSLRLCMQIGDDSPGGVLQLPMSQLQLNNYKLHKHSIVMIIVAARDSQPARQLSESHQKPHHDSIMGARRTGADLTTCDYGQLLLHPVSRVVLQQSASAVTHQHSPTCVYVSLSLLRLHHPSSRFPSTAAAHLMHTWPGNCWQGS